MRKLVLAFFFLTVLPVIAQEDCYDGIDNDADGDIDLNDDECTCGGFAITDTVYSLIPNPSFEDYSCCPTSLSMLSCADTWIQASTATSDYFNTCGITSVAAFSDPALPPPGGGDGYAGFHNSGGWKEYIGACLDAPMLAGETYVLNMWLAWSTGLTDFTFSFYGTTDCGDLPWATTLCPIGEGSWTLLDELPVSLTADGEWMEITLTFTPTDDIYAVCMGPECATLVGTNYYFVDELVLLDSSTFVGGGDITESGSWCDGDFLLNVDIDTVGGSWQWYYEGVALVGETGMTLDCYATGAGNYQAVYTLDTICELRTYALVIPDMPVADFTYSAGCDGDPVDFTDASTITSGSITDWDWDFGDAATSTTTDPTHTYAGPGSYTVELVVTSDVGCKDSIEVTVDIDPAPDALFSFEIGGESSTGGLTGGCYLELIDFVDASTIGGGGSITDWDWDFGDGNSSSATDPSHTYDAAGTYTITLTVTSDDGCTDVYTLDIVMTDGPNITILSNDPTCNGFEDGSVTVNIVGGSGSPTIVITDEDDVVKNIGGSNTANTLGTGWYYFNVDDDGCNAIDSVFLDNPPALAVDMDITNPLCFGDETGYAVVDEVFNAQGDLDNITYIWSPDPPGISGVGSDSLYNLGAGTYTLTLNDDNGCSEEFTFEIEEPTELVFTEIGYDPAYCRLFSYQSGNGVVFAAAGGGTPDYDYQWCGPIGLPEEDCTNSTTWGGLNPGTYNITITDANGCILTQQIELDSLNPVADFDVISSELNVALEGTAVVCAEFLNQSQNFANPNNPFADTTFWWNLDNPTATWILSKDLNEVQDTCYEEGGEYEICLVAQNKNGCVDTTCKIITVFDPLEFENVNIFSPDGDGINDVFTFTHLAKGVKTFHCVIVNRWGVTMAELNDIAEGWDGTDRNGSTCTNGVYFYTYDGEAENGTPFSGQGTIQIIGSK